MVSNRFQKHSKKLLFGFLILSIILIIFITETLLGPALPESKSRYIRLRENRPSTIRDYIPDDFYIDKTDGLEQKEYRFEIDKHGFIYPSIIHDDPDLSIIFLGGSTTECIYVDADKRFPNLVGRHLENENLKVNSINSGVSGNNSKHSINILINKCLKLNPDIAFLMHNINDLNILLYEKDYSNNNPYRSLIIEDDNNSITFHIKNIFRKILPNLYRRASLFNKRYVNIKIDDEFAHLRGKKLSIDTQHILDEFRKSLLTFISVAKSNNIMPVLMTQASRFKEIPDSIIIANWTLEDDFGIKYKNYREIYIAMNDLIREIGKTKNVHIIDLAIEIPQTKQYMYDAVHFNNNGSSLAADIIAFKLDSILNISQRMP